MKTTFFILLVAASVYVAAYFATLALPDSVRFRPRQMITYGRTTFSESSADVIFSGQRYPDFHGVPFAIFRPLHHIDRQFLRRSHWQPYPRNAELSFYWLVPDAPSALNP